MDIEQTSKAFAQTAAQIKQDTTQETNKLKLVETGRLRQSIDYRFQLCMPTLAQWQRAHVNGTTPPIIYVGPNGQQVLG